jgi:histidinol phosphatase-like enzyme
LSVKAAWTLRPRQADFPAMVCRSRKPNFELLESLLADFIADLMKK